MFDMGGKGGGGAASLQDRFESRKKANLSEDELNKRHRRVSALFCSGHLPKHVHVSSLTPAPPLILLAVNEKRCRGDWRRVRRIDLTEAAGGCFWFCASLASRFISP